MKSSIAQNINTQSSKILTKDFPEYLFGQLERLFTQALRQEGYLVYKQDEYYNYVLRLNDDFHNALCTIFKESCPEDWDNFIDFIKQDTEKTKHFIIFVISIISYQKNDTINKLENILRRNDSAYKVAYNTKQQDFKLEDRVPSIVEKQSKKALSDNDLLNQAWVKCYNSKNQNYDGVVRDCCSFLETFLGELYFPNDPKPQITKFIKDFEQNPDKLKYKGSTIVDPKNTISSLLKNIANIRGDHTGNRGNGRYPTSEEAEFILHTTIYIWNLHYGAS
jgi:hypothetical protein